MQAHTYPSMERPSYLSCLAVPHDILTANDIANLQMRLDKLLFSWSRRIKMMNGRAIACLEKDARIRKLSRRVALGTEGGVCLRNRTEDDDERHEMGGLFLPAKGNPSKPRQKKVRRAISLS